MKQYAQGPLKEFSNCSESVRSVIQSAKHVVQAAFEVRLSSQGQNLFELT